MVDPVARGAARWAAAIAVPLALVAGFVSYHLLTGAAHPAVSAAPAPQSTGPVTMPAPPLAERPATVCRALLSQLPANLRDRPRRPVTAGPEQNAAYGDPAITLACGAGPPPSLAPDATVYNLSGVCWYASPGSTATAWTTVDREVPVTVTVPNSYAGQGTWVIEFSPVIGSSVPGAASVPGGCH
jgi:uncharacterized protein DUF3515